MNPFEFVNAINSNKDIIRTSDNKTLMEKSYIPFFVNKALSYHIDSIYYANEMNLNNHLDNLLQNDYYLNSLRARKRFAKWHKKTESSDVEAIREYYGVSYSRALEYSKVLNSKQLSHIKEKIIKGGNNVQNKSTDRG